MNPGSNVVARPMRHRLTPHLAFLAPFSLYTATAVVLLALGLASAAVGALPSVAANLSGWTAGGGLLAPLSQGVAEAAALTEPAPLVVADYLVSAFDVAGGLFLLWHRPGDRVVRLLALGMVGTAVAFNYQVHGLFYVARPIVVPGLVPLNVLHLAFHAISGAAYLHALLLFPNGRLVPRAFRLVPRIVYGLMAIDLVVIVSSWLLNGRTFTLVGSLVSLPLFLARGISPFDRTVGAALEDFVHAEELFYVLFFAVLIPTLGVSAQVIRYRRASGIEREQTRLVVAALVVAFSVGILFFVLSTASLAGGAVFSVDASEWLADSVVRILPLTLSIIPAALLVAVFRYRLFEINVVLGRALVYAPLTAALTLVFIAGVWALQQLLRPLLGGPSEIAVALAALMNGLLFQPLRRRLIRTIERRLLPPAAVTAAGPRVAPGR